MTEPAGGADAEMVEGLTRMLQDLVPHNRAIGLEVVRFRPGEVWTRIRWKPELVGNPVTGVLHGGAISTLVDATCGLAIMARLGRPSSIATLDLRIDYLRPATPRRDVIAHATCTRVTRHVCFVRGVAYHAEDDAAPADERGEAAPIAHVAGTFARKS